MWPINSVLRTRGGGLIVFLGKEGSSYRWRRQGEKTEYLFSEKEWKLLTDGATRHWQ